MGMGWNPLGPTGTHWDIFEKFPGILGVHWDSTGKGWLSDKYCKKCNLCPIQSDSYRNPIGLLLEGGGSVKYCITVVPGQ